MNRLALYIILIFVFFLLGALFSAAEMALVTLREPQIRALAHRGKRGRTIAELAHNPNRFISAVQIGSTLAGFLSASFGAATLAKTYTSPLLERWGLGATAADIISVVVITLLISFLSIVLSELTSKRLAMQNPESFALALAPLVAGLASLFRPVIWLMGVCTNALVRLFGGDPLVSRQNVSDAELRSMVVASPTLGAEERHIVSDVFDVGDRSLREVMIPRTEVHFLASSMLAADALRELKDAPFSRYPVIGRSMDQVLGFVHLRDLAVMDDDTRRAPVGKLVRPVEFLPETVRVMRALTDMRRAHAHLAIVVDEYGGTAGIVTLEDLVEELIGEITDEYDQPLIPGAGEFDGLTTLEEFAETTGYVLPEGPYDTLAGYFTAQLGEVATQGDAIKVSLARDADTAGVEEEADAPEETPLAMLVMSMDGRRIERIKVEPA